MAIVTKTLQQMRQDLSAKLSDLEPFGGPGVADSGGTAHLIDTMLQYYPDDHFNGWEITVLFATPESRMVTDFTSSSSSIVFAPALSASAGTAQYELRYHFRKQECDRALNNGINSVANVALIDKVSEEAIYRKGQQVYNIPDGFVAVYDVQEMDNSDGISLKYGMGSNPTDIVLGTNGIQNYLRLSQSILTKSNAVTYVPAVALLLRDAGGDTTARSMRVAIYSDDGSGGPDAALYISDAVASSILDEIPRWIRFPFATQARLEADTRYHIVFYDGHVDAARRYGWLENQDTAYDSEKIYGYYSTTGVRQIETLTVSGAAAQQGAARVTVTAAGMPNSPVSVIVDLLAGDTASDIGGKIRTALTDAAPDVVSFFSIGGSTTTVQLTAKAPAANDPTMNIAIADGAWNGIAEVPFSTNTTSGATAGTKQVETVTVVGTITAGTQQVETFTLPSPAYSSGTFHTVVTAAGMTNSPVTVTTTRGSAGTAAELATAIRADLALNANISNFFTIGGTGSNIVLTAKTAAANDATMDIDLTEDPADSADTTAGVASGAGTVSLVVTASGMTGSPVTSTDVDVLAGWTATQVASAIASQVTTENANISNFFTITSSGADVIFTAKTAAANDATMNIAIDNGTCAGLTADATSANTTAGVAASVGTAQVETLTVLGTVNGSGWLKWTVTASGLTVSPMSGQVYVKDSETAIEVAANLRAGLKRTGATPAPMGDRPPGTEPIGPVADFFTIAGTGADVVLTAKTAAANDATMNLAISNPTLSGITAVATSTNTTAGAGAIEGSWTSLSTTKGMAFVVYANDPNWQSIPPTLWALTRSTPRTISVNKTLGDGVPLRILGLQAPTEMSKETDKCPINPEYVLEYAAADLAAKGIRRSDNDGENWAMQTKLHMDKAEQIRPRMKTRWPANAKLVEVQ